MYDHCPQSCWQADSDDVSAHQAFRRPSKRNKRTRNKGCRLGPTTCLPGLDSSSIIEWVEMSVVVVPGSTPTQRPDWHQGFVRPKKTFYCRRIQMSRRRSFSKHTQAHTTRKTTKKSILCLLLVGSKTVRDLSLPLKVQRVSEKPQWSVGGCTSSIVDGSDLQSFWTEPLVRPSSRPYTGTSQGNHSGTRAVSVSPRPKMWHTSYLFIEEQQ